MAQVTRLGSQGGQRTVSVPGPSSGEPTQTSANQPCAPKSNAKKKAKLKEADLKPSPFPML